MSQQFPVTLVAPSYLQGVTPQNDDLMANTAGGFPVVSFRGRVWRIITGGESTPVMDADQQPMPSIEVVMVKANPLVSKIFYEAAYVEGSDDPPDCFSNDGITPDMSIEEPQSESCQTCHQNVWGSKITPQGTKVKACSDSRRMAVVPAGEVVTGRDGLGAMLLRVPPASLEGLRNFGQQLNQRGIQYQAVIVRIGFDLDASYPKLVFGVVRALTEEEYKRVLNMASTDVVSRILGGMGNAEFAKPATPLRAVPTQPAPAPAPAAPAFVPPPPPPPAAVAPVAPAAPPAAPRRRRTKAEMDAARAQAAQQQQPSAPPTVQGTLFGTAGAPPTAAHPPATGMNIPPNLDISSIVSSALKSLDDAKQP